METTITVFTMLLAPLTKVLVKSSTDIRAISATTMAMMMKAADSSLKPQPQLMIPMTKKMTVTAKASRQSFWGLVQGLSGSIV